MTPDRVRGGLYFGVHITCASAGLVFASASFHAAHVRRLHAVLRVKRSLWAPYKAKRPELVAQGVFPCRVLTMTYFHAVYPALSSARLRFTVLFGMGRRGPTALCSSGIQLPGITRHSVTPDVFWKKYLGSTIATKAAEHFAQRSKL